MIAHGKEIKVFTANANVPFAKGICAELGLDLGDSTVTAFADGEVSVSINESVRGCDVFVVQSTCKPVNNNLMELLIMIDAFRRASAGRITAVIPYFGYARQDRKAKGRDPISAKLVANLITRAGADRVLTMDLHAAQIQGFFDIPVDNMLGNPLFTRYYMSKFDEKLFNHDEFVRRFAGRRLRRPLPHLRGQGPHGPCHRGQAPPARQHVRGHEHHRRRRGQDLHPV